MPATVLLACSLDLFAESLVIADYLECHLGGFLLTLLLAVTTAIASRNTFNLYLGAERRTVVFVHHLVYQLEAHLHLVLLTPLDEARLEVHLLARHLVQVNVLLQDLLFHELHAAVVAAVQIDGSDEGLEGIAVEVGVVRLRSVAGLHQFVEPNFYGQLVECFALHDFRAGIGQESFASSLKVAIDNISNYGIQYRIAQKLQSLVVEQSSLIGAYGGRFMQQGLLVVLQLAGVEAQDTVKTKIRLPFLAEKEPYPMYEVAQHNLNTWLGVFTGHTS